MNKHIQRLLVGLGTLVYLILVLFIIGFLAVIVIEYSYIVSIVVGILVIICFSYMIGWIKLGDDD